MASRRGTKGCGPAAGSDAALALQPSRSIEADGLPSPATPTAIKDSAATPTAAETAAIAGGTTSNVLPPQRGHLPAGKPAVSGAAATASQPEYADVLRARFRRELEEEQATAWRRIKRRVERTWHWFSITWGLYIMEPWEITIVLACLLGTLATALHGLWMLAAWLRAAEERLVATNGHM